MNATHTAPCGCQVFAGSKLEPAMGIAQTCGEHSIVLGQLRRQPAKQKALVQTIIVSAIVASIQKMPAGAVLK